MNTRLSVLAGLKPAKTIIAVAGLYKGVLIFETLNECVIFNENGQRIPFADQSEAEAFVDAWEIAACRLDQVPVMERRTPIS